MIRNEEAPPSRRLRLAANRGWLLATIAWVAACTGVAYLQEPAPVTSAWSSPPSFWKPVETNPFRRLPHSDESWNSLVFNRDGLRGWAASDHNIVSTTDGGETWAPQAAPAMAIEKLFMSSD